MGKQGVGYEVKVYGPYVAKVLNHMPIFDRYMARLGLKNGHETRHVYEIDLCLQNIDIILGFKNEYNQEGLLYVAI